MAVWKEAKKKRYQKVRRVSEWVSEWVSEGRWWHFFLFPDSFCCRSFGRSALKRPFVSFVRSSLRTKRSNQCGARRGQEKIISTSLKVTFCAYIIYKEWSGKRVFFLRVEGRNKSRSIDRRHFKTLLFSTWGRERKSRDKLKKKKMSRFILIAILFISSTSSQNDFLGLPDGKKLLIPFLMTRLRKKRRINKIVFTSCEVRKEAPWLNFHVRLRVFSVKKVITSHFLIPEWAFGRNQLLYPLYLFAKVSWHFCSKRRWPFFVWPPPKKRGRKKVSERQSDSQSSVVLLISIS